MYLVKYQLRIYTVRPGQMAAWTEEWNRSIAPLRRRFGFTILGPWIVESEDMFVWILGYDGPEGFQAADSVYYTSPDRQSVAPDPARHLLKAEEWPMRAA